MHEDDRKENVIICFRPSLSKKQPSRIVCMKVLLEEKMYLRDATDGFKEEISVLEKKK